MESVILTIGERLEDLRKKRKLTLDELSEATGISRSALGKYESQDFKDVSPFSIVTLAKFYGVSADYLLGISNMEKPSDAEIQDLHLSDTAIEALKKGKLNGALLSEVISHKDFERLLVDMEIFVDGTGSMQIDNLNTFMGMARKTVQAKHHPDENELFYRTFELANISGDEYVSSVLRDDLRAILRDIREAHKQAVKDDPVTPPIAAIEDFQKKVQSTIDARGTDQEKAAKVYLSAFGIDYDSLTPEEFVVLIGILEKSSYKETSINRRGRRQGATRKKRKK